MQHLSLFKLIFQFESKTMDNYEVGMDLAWSPRFSFIHFLPKQHSVKTCKIFISLDSNITLKMYNNHLGLK